jgi:transcriptional regulator with XRE-family HTH domain
VSRPRTATPAPRNRLHVLRAERWLTQGQAADRVGIKRPRYWRIEAGITYPTDDELEAIERELGRDHGLGRAQDRPRSTDFESSSR